MKMKTETVLKLFRHLNPLRPAWLVAILLFALAGSASAHALLDYALPRVGSTITNSPGQILICFTTNLKLTGSSIQVRDAEGKQVDKKDSHCDAHDWAKLYVSLPELPPGTYKVSWKALGDDNHTTEGSFKFTIKKPTAD